MEQKLNYYLNNRNFAKPKTKRKKEPKTERLTVVDGKIVLNPIQLHHEDSENITSYTYMKKKPCNAGKRWSKAEDVLFFDALECCGCDFSIMTLLFPNRTRSTLKSKYKREYRKGSKIVESMQAGLKQFDPARFDELRKRAQQIKEAKKP